MLEETIKSPEIGNTCKETSKNEDLVDINLSDEDAEIKPKSITKKDEIVDRWFKLVRINGDKLLVEHSYQGKRPNSVAVKAFNWYCRRNGKQEFECTFTIQDQTSNKNYEYTGSRKLLDVPLTINRLGVEYKVNYTTTVRRN